MLDLLIIASLNDLEDHVHAEPAPLQEARLLAALSLATRQPTAEFPAPDLACRRELTVLQILHRAGDRLARDAFGKEVALDALHPEPGAARMHHLLHYPPLGQPAAGFQLVEQAIDLGGVRAVFIAVSRVLFRVLFRAFFQVGRELAPKLRPRMLTPREQFERPRLETLRHTRKG